MSSEAVIFVLSMLLLTSTMIAHLRDMRTQSVDTQNNGIFRTFSSSEFDGERQVSSSSLEASEYEDVLDCYDLFESYNRAFLNQCFNEQGRPVRPFGSPIPSGLYYLNGRKWLPLDVIYQQHWYLGSLTKPQLDRLGSVDAKANEFQVNSEVRVERLHAIEKVGAVDVLRSFWKRLLEEAQYAGESNVRSWIQRVLHGLSWWHQYAWSMLSKAIRSFLQLREHKERQEEALPSATTELRFQDREAWAMPLYLEQGAGDTFTLQCMQTNHDGFGRFLVYDATNETLRVGNEHEPPSHFRAQQMQRDEWYKLEVLDEKINVFRVIDMFFPVGKLVPTVAMPSNHDQHQLTRAAHFQFLEASDLVAHQEILNMAMQQYPHLLKNSDTIPMESMESSIQRLDDVPDEKLHQNFLQALRKYPKQHREYMKQVKKYKKPGNSDGKSGRETQMMLRKEKEPRQRPLHIGSTHGKSPKSLARVFHV